jgi:uncharacterized membrane protein
VRPGLLLKRALGILAVALFFAVVSGAAWIPKVFPHLGLDKYYDYPRVVVDAYVHPDGSMSVVERRTFDFQKGSFTYAFADIKHRQPGDIVGVRVSEASTEYRPFSPFGGPGPLDPGILQVSDGSSSMDITWRFVAQDEERTFVLRYKALCAVDVFPDGAHLYWQFIPADVDKPTDHATITVHLPGHFARIHRPDSPCTPSAQAGRHRPQTETPLGPGEIKAWGHGPLQGNARIVDPQTVRLDIHDVPAYKFVEASVLFPKNAVPYEGMTAVGNGPSGTVHSAHEVFLQEEQLAADANATRRRVQVFDAVWRVGAIAFPVLLIALLVVALRRDRVPGVPRELRDPPEDIHPVDLAILWGSYAHESPTKNAYRAQLLWLAQQGVISVQADGQVSKPDDLEVTFVKEPADGLDSEFTEFLFAEKGVGPFKLSQIKAEGKRATELREWSKDVTDRLQHRMARRKGRWEARTMTWAMLVLGAGSVLAAVQTHRGSVPWLLIPEAIVLWGVARWNLHPYLRGSERERVAQWAAFRRFLRKFSSLPDAPALAVVIWEKYLVYATALGIAHEVVRQVKAIIPEQELPSPWMGAPSGTTGFLWANSISTRAPVAASVASSSGGTSWSGSSGGWSSGGGGGGGFSGGGGGGGGGGGRGAG